MKGSVRCLDCKPPRALADCTCRGPARREMRVFVGHDPVTGRAIQRSRTVHAGKRDAQEALNGFIASVLEERTGSVTVSTTSTLSELMDRWVHHTEDKGRGAGHLRNARRHAAAVGRSLGDVLATADSEAIETAFERAGLDDAVESRPTGAQRERFVRLFFAAQADKRRGWLDVDFVLGDVKLDRLVDDHIEAYYDALVWIGRKPRTVNGYHASIRGALNYAQQKRWIIGNPAKGTARPPLRDPELVVPTPAQVIELVATAAQMALEWGAFLAVAAGTWARRGEVVALRRSNLDLARREVMIAFSVSREQGLKDTKTHASRRLRIDAGTAGAIEDQLELMAKRAAAAGVELVDDPFLFSDQADGSAPWHPDTPSRFFEDVRIRAGIVGVRLHDLRHFGATQAISAGMPITAVSKRLGHSKVTTTLSVYAHWLPADDDDLADLMAELLGGKPPKLRAVS